MAKRNGSGKALALVAWLTGILVSLAVGFGMIDGVLNIRWIHPTITVIVGWIVVITTLTSAVLALIKR